MSALLLHLSGTIPVLFRGTTYRFPIALWVPHAYPLETPLLYVTPTEGMMVRPGQHVDPQGKVYHPYLVRWAEHWDVSEDLLQDVNWTGLMTSTEVQHIRLSGDFARHICERASSHFSTATKSPALSSASPGTSPSTTTSSWCNSNQLHIFESDRTSSCATPASTTKTFRQSTTIFPSRVIEKR